MCWDPTLPLLLLDKSYNLCLALLRANKAVHCEVSPLLYSYNRFEFTNLLPTPRFSTKSVAIASFFSQIGRQNASFLRHICIDFPAPDNSPERYSVQEDIRVLELIRDNCTGIAILETLLCRCWPLEDYRGTMLELPNTYFKAIPSLNEVIVNIHSDDYDLSNSVLKKMHSYGWTTKRMEPISEELSDLDWDDFIYADLVDSMRAETPIPKGHFPSLDECE
jgi:hypothetical protein